MLWPNIFFNVPLPFLFENSEVLDQYPVNVEVFADGVVLEGLGPRRVDEARAILDARGLRRRVHGPYSEIIPGAVDPRVRDVARNRLLQALDFAGRLGADAVVFHTGYDTLNNRDAEDGYRERSVPVLRDVCGEAARRGITLLMENVYEAGPGMLIDTLSDVGSDNLKLCFDVGHQRVFGKVPLDEWLKSCASLIDEIHLSDNAGGWDDHLAPGKGDIEFSVLFGLLSEYGIGPVMTFEPHSLEDFVGTLEFIQKNKDLFGTR